MATAFTAPHTHHTLTFPQTQRATEKRVAEKGAFAQFAGDLLEDVRQKPLQAAEFAKHDMFREHINAMAISYFALIVVLTAASLPILAYAVSY